MRIQLGGHLHTREQVVAQCGSYVLWRHLGGPLPHAEQEQVAGVAGIGDGDGTARGTPAIFGLRDPSHLQQVLPFPLPLSLSPSLPLSLCDSTPSTPPPLVRVQACNVHMMNMCPCPNARLRQVLKVAVVLDRLVMQVLCLQNK